MKNYKMGLLGKKLGMTTIFIEDGKTVPVTVVQAGPCSVVQVKTVDTAKYNAIQLGFDEGKPASFTKPLQGHFTKAKTASFKLLGEIRLPAEEIKNFSVGQVVGADIFSEGDFIDVSGISKGKGFAGVVKRHHFSGAPASHGAHEYFRHGGSVGQHSYPGRIFKGVGMPGQLGAAKSTVQNLKVAKVVKEKNLILIRGAVPGANGGYLVIRKAIKKKAKAAGAKGGR